MHGVDIGRPSPIRTRDRPAASRGGGVCCDRDAIPRTWLVHLGSARLIGCGRAKVRWVNPLEGRSLRRRANIAPLAPRPYAVRRQPGTAEY